MQNAIDKYMLKQEEELHYQHLLADYIMYFHKDYDFAIVDIKNIKTLAKAFIEIGLEEKAEDLTDLIIKIQEP
jgi:hypothetical protein